MSKSHLLSNSIWPNSEGPLGQNKVQIPDGVTVKWPEGDALIGNFVYDGGHLVGFVDTKALIVNDSKSTTLPYDYVNIRLTSIKEGDMTFNKGERCKYLTITYSSANSGDTIVLGTKYINCRSVDEIVAIDPNYLTNDIVDGVWNQSLEKLDYSYSGEKEGCGQGMFHYCSNLTTFTSDLSSLTNGYDMFYGCTNLTAFSSDLSSLTNAYGMFYNCSKLTTFTSDSNGSPVNLSSLTDGEWMFYCCSNLTTFTSDLNSLTYGYSMFKNCSNLTTFTSDLSSLTNGDSMFAGCTNLTTFTSDLSSLANGWFMFSSCTNFTSFTSDLSSLTKGDDMFRNCKLDTSSVQNIANTIKPYNGIIHIGIGNSSPNSEENEAFNTMSSKGWTVYVNGSNWNSSPHPFALTDENGEEPVDVKPFYAKPVPSDEEHARYMDAEGNFFNILGAQFIYGDDISTYGMFINEEDAAANMRLTKIVKEDIETA